MDKPTLQAFEGEIKKHLPTFRIAYKDEVAWMKVLAFFAMPFNPGFMTKFTTTIGNTVYFPSKAYYENQPKASFTVLAHEFVHMMDSSKYPGWFQLSYALPQVVSPILLGAYAIFVPYGWLAVATLMLGVLLGCVAARKSVAFFFLIAGTFFLGAAFLTTLLTHWWSVLFFVGLAFLTPLPSPGRVYWEMRGYVMNLAVMAWTFGPPPAVVKSMISRHFYGPDYFFMSWSKASIEKQFDEAIVKARSGSLQEDLPYRVVYEFLVAKKLLRDA